MITKNDKIILDGHGKKLLAVRGKYTDYCPDGPGYDYIEIQTDKGTLRIKGCSNCHVLDTYWEDS
uniref:Uncharacterized protein n=1 Tax=viral metagenome TaxID=1070528 RepID=A0A6M3LYN8_9ZZZZ